MIFDLLLASVKLAAVFKRCVLPVLYDDNLVRDNQFLQDSLNFLTVGTISRPVQFDHKITPENMSLQRDIIMV
jgi:hypothetical protein